MSRKFMTALLSSALVFGGISTSAWSANEFGKPAQMLAAQASMAERKNEAPLAPGGAAGIKQAQGIVGTGLILIGAVVLTAVIVAVVLLNDDDSDEGVSTGTN